MLWAPDAGRTYNEQKYFNDNFGAFFRVNQIIISAGPNFKEPGTSSSTKNRVLSRDECAEKKKANPLFLTEKEFHQEN